MRTLAEFLEKFLFIKKTGKFCCLIKFIIVQHLILDPETDAGFIEKRTMFDMWVTFNKSYIDFPSKTTSKCIIRYYGIDKEFTNELESLIDILQTLHPGAFAQTVAVAVMLFSIEDQFESFKKFWKCMVKRIIVKHDKQMVAVGANIMVIATCIMRQLTTHMHNCANNSNRLAILDYIVFLLKDYNINNRASL